MSDVVAEQLRRLMPIRRATGCVQERNVIGDGQLLGGCSGKLAERNRLDPAMKIFLDTAEIEEIRIAARWGVLDGVTTNPSLFAKVGGSYDDLLKEICKLTSGPVSAEVIAEDVGKTNASMVYVLASEHRAASGYRAVGYVAKGPSAGPLVVGEFRAVHKSADQGDYHDYGNHGDGDIGRLIDRNVKG